jgi:putative dehydrogenase
MQAGVIGIGDMGSGMAKNLIAAGISVTGFDVAPDRLAQLKELGGIPAASVAEVGRNSQTVFVMVMNGAQALNVIAGPDGLADTMAAGGTIILTATIKPSEAASIAEAVANSGIDLVDSPVSGGFEGAQNGALTMMAAARPEVLEKVSAEMEAVSKTIHIVGSEIGMGQTVKACLQSLIGSVFSASFEAAVLAAKAGVDPQILHRVFATSGAGNGITNNALEKIMQGRFVGTGSHISTMHKDLTIVTDMARELGVPLFTATIALQLFEAGKTKYPEGDNWIVAKMLEEIVGVEFRA